MKSAFYDWLMTPALQTIIGHHKDGHESRNEMASELANQVTYKDSAIMSLDKFISALFAGNTNRVLPDVLVPWFVGRLSFVYHHWTDLIKYALFPLVAAAAGIISEMRDAYGDSSGVLAMFETMDRSDARQLANILIRLLDFLDVISDVSTAGVQRIDNVDVHWFGRDKWNGTVVELETKFNTFMVGVDSLRAGGSVNLADHLYHQLHSCYRMLQTIIQIATVMIAVVARTSGDPNYSSYRPHIYMLASGVEPERGSEPPTEEEDVSSDELETF